MATIANLAVSVTARISSFEKNINKAMRLAGRFGSDLARHTMTIVKYGAALVAAAVGGLSILVKSQMEAIDGVVKLARVMNMTNEQLVGYHHLAELGGVSTETFNKSVIKMNRSIVDAANGSKNAKRELASVGLEAEDFAKLSTDERIKLLADRYLRIGDAAERSSFLLTVFGRAGIGMGTLFEKGAAGIEEAAKEAERLGLTFNELDGRGVEEANDMLTRVKAMLTGIGRTIAIVVAPYIVGLANWFLNAAGKGEDMGERVTSAFQWILKALGRVADYFELAKAAWYSFEAVVQTGGGIVVSMIGLVAKAVQELMNLMGMDVTFGDNILASVADFKAAAIESSEKAAMAYEKFDKKANSSNMEKLFERLKAKGEEIIAASSGASGLGDDGMGEADGGNRLAFARAVDLRRVTVGGPGTGGDGSTTKKQGDKMIELQKTIARNTGFARAVVT